MRNVINAQKDDVFRIRMNSEIKNELEEVFANNHSDFIEQVNQSFDSMLKNYHVKMPISEIAYLYEYIADDEDERKVASDDEF